MNKLLALSLSISFSLTCLYGGETTVEMSRKDSVRAVIDNFAKIKDKEVKEVDKIKNMFRKGQVSGQLKLMYAEASEPGDAYATAIGGIIKYELAEYRGFNAGAAVYTSYDIPFASGEGIKRNTEMSSDLGNHTEISEAYLNYRYNDFNFRAGRQVLNTPLADTDDVRMIQNTFEAYVATYNLQGFELMAGNIQTWHGTDAGLELGWSKTGKEGTNFGGVAYANGIEFDAWYYNITGKTDAAYFDIGIEYELTDKVLLHTMVQYLTQSELDNSAIEASIYGALFEVVAYDIGVNVAVNKSEKKAAKESFSGFGGGALFTSLDTMTIDEITLDRDAFSYVLGVVYSYDDFGLLYAYGDFDGAENSSGDRAHIVEQNIGASYDFNSEFVVGAIYVVQDDKIDSSNNWTRLQVMLNYNF